VRRQEFLCSIYESPLNSAEYRSWAYFDCACCCLQ